MALDRHESISVFNIDGTSGLVLCCEHASYRIPQRLGGLVAPEDSRRHIAWDPGACGVAAILSRLLDATLISSTVSRLVIDCNRDPADADSISVISETTEIPGNRDITAEERARRIRDVYNPFHHALAEVLDAKATKKSVGLASIHSFTPNFRGIRRPWDVGIIFDDNDGFARPIVNDLKRCKSRNGNILCVGVNEPYSPRDRVYHTIGRHASSLGRPGLMIEIRNDLIADAADQEWWADMFANILSCAITRGDVPVTASDAMTSRIARGS
ncbi:MAG: N-formylglutamate amidohydrolase [Pseudolabrys sp.]|nr:N-formylglutamate amidohydrolase [Pseudolabrys sp.]